jgi:extradiol dioxygenase family protein
MKCEICIDVDDVAKAVRFHGEGIGLSVVKHEEEWAQLKLGEQTIWLMKVPSGKGRSIHENTLNIGRPCIWTSTSMI